MGRKTTYHSISSWWGVVAFPVNDDQADKAWLADVILNSRVGLLLDPVPASEVDAH